LVPAAEEDQETVTQMETFAPAVSVVVLAVRLAL
jgi:hypothetical protein